MMRRAQSHVKGLILKIPCQYYLIYKVPIGETNLIYFSTGPTNDLVGRPTLSFPERKKNNINSPIGYL